VTTNFQFQLFLFIEALQGVHRARRERQEIGRNFSGRNPLDLSYRNPSDARSARGVEAFTRKSSGGITFQRSVIEIQEIHLPGETKVEPSGLRKFSKSKRSKSSEGRTLSTVGSWRRLSDRRIRDRCASFNVAHIQEGESRRSERTVESPRGETSKPRRPLDKVELRGG
jgi:hypothetical protein